MLAKMGWQAGSGLGQSGEGIVIPIESKLRPHFSLSTPFEKLIREASNLKRASKACRSLNVH